MACVPKITIQVIEAELSLLVGMAEEVAKQYRTRQTEDINAWAENLSKSVANLTD